MAVDRSDRRTPGRVSETYQTGGVGARIWVCIRSARHRDREGAAAGRAVDAAKAWHVAVIHLLRRIELRQHVCFGEIDTATIEDLSFFCLRSRQLPQSDSKGAVS